MTYHPTGLLFTDQTGGVFGLTVEQASRSFSRSHITPWCVMDRKLKQLQGCD